MGEKFICLFHGFLNPGLLTEHSSENVGATTQKSHSFWCLYKAIPIADQGLREVSPLTGGETFFLSNSHFCIYPITFIVSMVYMLITTVLVT